MTGIITRRNFLRSMMAAPAIVAASSLMPVRAIAALDFPAFPAFADLELLGPFTESSAEYAATMAALYRHQTEAILYLLELRPPVLSAGPFRLGPIRALSA